MAMQIGGLHQFAPFALSRLILLESRLENSGSCQEQSGFASGLPLELPPGAQSQWGDEQGFRQLCIFPSLFKVLLGLSL